MQQKAASGQAVRITMRDVLVRSLPLLNFVLALAAIFLALAPSYAPHLGIHRRSEPKPEWHQVVERSLQSTDLAPLLEKRGFVDTLGDIGKAIIDGVTGGVTNTTGGSWLDNIVGSFLNGTGSVIKGPAGSLGIGVGAGVASGLGTSKAAVDAAVNKSMQLLDMKGDGIDPAIQNIAMGLASSLVGSLTAKNASTTTAQAATTGPQNITLLGLDIPAAALGLGQGLGSGAASGLKLTTTAKAATSNDIGSVMNNLAFGLTQSLLGGLNFTAVQNMMGPMPDMNAVLKQVVAPAAAGIGRGIGKGAAIGLGVQPASSGTVSKRAIAKRDAASNGTLVIPFDVGDTAEGLAEGLVSQFLTGGTVQKIIADPSIITGNSTSTSSAAGGLSNINLGGVTNGLIRGILQGAADSVTAVGGVDSIVAGNATLPKTLPNSTLAFNDGVGGAATGFGLGLGGQGVLAAVQLLGKGGANLLGGASKTKRDVVTETGLEPRQASASAVATADGGLNISVILSANAISTVGQGAVDALHCQGIGGAILLVNNLFGGKSSSSSPTDSDSVKQVLQQLIPKGIIRLVSDRNTYDIDGATVSNAIAGNGSVLDAVKVNNMAILSYFIVVALHAVVGLGIFFFALPAIIGLESLVPSTQKKMTTSWYVLVAPGSVLVQILGFVVGAKGVQHFATAHGVLGLLTGLTALAIGVLRFVSRNKAELQAQFQAPLMRNLVSLALLIMTLATVFTGFGDVAAATLCYTQTIPFTTAMGLGVLLGSVFVLGISANLLELGMSIRDNKRGQGQVPIGISSAEKGNAIGEPSNAAAMHMENKLRPMSQESGAMGVYYPTEKIPIRDTDGLSYYGVAHGQPQPQAQQQYSNDPAPRPGMPPFRIIAGGAQDVLNNPQYAHARGH